MGQTLYFLNLPMSKIMKTLSKMKPKVSMGIDLISNKVLKCIAPVIIDPLRHVYNLSLGSGFIHCTLKTSLLKPLFKADSRSDFTNYRPISLLSAVVKLLEKHVCKQLCLHLGKGPKKM